MGCKRDAFGRRRILSGRHVAVCFLLVSVVSLADEKAFPQGGAGSGGPGPFSFGYQQVDTRSSPQAIHLQNTGVTVLVITSIQATANFGETDNCKPSVAVGANCTIEVTFNPTTSGPLTGTLTVTSNTAGPPYVVQLNGTGILPAPEVSPANLNFNNQVAGTTSAPQQVTFTNTGNLPLSITNLTVSNGWTQNNNCLPSVAAKGSCTVNVSFRPISSGPVNGALTFSEYAANSPQSVTLSGTGVAPMVKLSPSSLAFSGPSVSTTSAPQSITLTNTGNGTLTNLTITASGDFAQTNNCASSVDASGSCTINVTFTPTANGKRTGALTLTDSASDSPQTVNLSGSVGAATVWLVASSLAFSSQRLGTTSPQITLELSADQPLAITSISITGNNSSDFSLNQNCGNSLAANTPCQITLTFTPTSAGARSASVSIVDDAANSPQTISLTGTGASPAAGASSQP